MSSGSRQGLPQCGPGASLAARVQPHDGDSLRTRLWFGGEAVLGGPWDSRVKGFLASSSHIKSPPSTQVTVNNSLWSLSLT